MIAVPWIGWASAFGHPHNRLREHDFTHYPCTMCSRRGNRQFRLSAPRWGTFTSLATEPADLLRHLVTEARDKGLEDALPTLFDVAEISQRDGHEHLTYRGTLSALSLAFVP